MLLSSISFLLGIGIIQQLAVLPQLIFFTLLPFIWWLAYHFRRSSFSLLLRGLSFALTGMFWASFIAHHYLDHRLPESLAGKDILIEGKISQIPTSKGGIQRFVLDVDSFETDAKSQSGQAPSLVNLPKKLRISWYYAQNEVRSGETWRLLVRLKPPHGFLNPGGFDYEAWLYQQSIHATGYVRKSELNRRIEAASHYSIDAIRQTLNQNINRHLKYSEHRGLISALAVGDRSNITKQQWDDLIKTGTNHLMAISGLHIGLAAAFGYWISRRLLPSVVMKRISAQQLSIAIGALVALMYALLAGLSIPTQRALIMLVCIAAAMCLKRHFRPVDALSVALFLVLLFDPVSVLSAGFWFSFLAVAVIFYALRDRSKSEELVTQDTEMDTEDTGKSSLVSGLRKKCWQWGSLQLVITLALFPLSLFMFQQSSLISPVANFIMVPYVSFLVVPLVLMAIMLMPLVEPVAILILHLANQLIEFIWPLLYQLAELPLSHWVHHVSGLPVTLLAMSGVLILLSNINWRFRVSGTLLVIPLLIGSSEKPLSESFELSVFDVGQGLSALVRTENHVLLYDTGARFSDQLDSAQAVILPALRAFAIHKLDKLIISHGDNDHIGGAMSILSAFPGVKLIGQDIESLSVEDNNRTLCNQAMKWHWDGVDFEFLHPVADESYKKRNNRSCVLKITAKGGSLLLSGDIEKKIEKQLLQTPEKIRDIDVIVVPHHGSKSSSSKNWLAVVNPKIALITAGYRNRYRLPSLDIVQRYRDQDTRLLSTASSGAISLLFHPQQGVIINDRYRISQSRYWNHQLPEM